MPVVPANLAIRAVPATRVRLALALDKENPAQADRPVNPAIPAILADRATLAVMVNPEIQAHPVNLANRAVPEISVRLAIPALMECPVPMRPIALAHHAVLLAVVMFLQEEAAMRSAPQRRIRERRQRSRPTSIRL